MQGALPVDTQVARASVVEELKAVLSRKHLPMLDGLRAIAVFTVISYHGGVPGVHGDLGVTGFFVLSGFLITWLLFRELDTTGSVSFRNFYVRRGLRIVPAYYTFVLLSIAADFVLDDPWKAWEAAAALGYAVNYVNAFTDHNGPVAHAWSLAVEEQFYLLWPVLFLTLARRGWRTLVWGLGVLVIAVVSWRSWLFVGWDVGAAYVYNAFDTRFDSLAIGCLLAVAVRSERFRLLARRSVTWPWLPLVTLTLLLWSRGSGSPVYHYALGFTVDSALIAILIVQLLQLARSGAWSWLEWPSVRYLGRISYPLYLWHGWALTAAGKLGTLPWMGRFAVAVALSIALASASYYVVERPFLSLKRHWQSHK